MDGREQCRRSDDEFLYSLLRQNDTESCILELIHCFDQDFVGIAQGLCPVFLLGERLRHTADYAEFMPAWVLIRPTRACDPGSVQNDRVSGLCQYHFVQVCILFLCALARPALDNPGQLFHGHRTNGTAREHG